MLLGLEGSWRHTVDLYVDDEMEERVKEAFDCQEYFRGRHGGVLWE